MPAARELYIAGTGSFALEVVEYAAAAGFAVVGLVELLDPSRIGTRIHDRDVVGASPGAGRRVVVGLGGDRLGHWATLADSGWSPGTVLHPRADISRSAVVGDGSIVGPGAVVGAASELGLHTLAGRGVLVGHHVRVGDGVTLNPGVNVGGNAEIGAGAVIGMGAIIANGISVGTRAVVAAGAVVVRPVEPQTRVQGVPARLFSSA